MARHFSPTSPPVVWERAQGNGSIVPVVAMAYRRAPAKWSWVCVRMSCWEMFGCHDVSYWHDKHVCHFWFYGFGEKSCSFSSMKVDGKKAGLFLVRFPEGKNFETSTSIIIFRLPCCRSVFMPSKSIFFYISSSEQKTGWTIEETPKNWQPGSCLVWSNKMGLPGSDCFWVHAHPPWMTLKLEIHPARKTPKPASEFLETCRPEGEEQLVASLFLPNKKLKIMYINPKLPHHLH